MANHNLTDLLPNWHLLPAGGGRILKDERYAIVDEDGRSISIFTSDADWTAIADRRVLTEHLVTPPLPTEPGTQILASIRSDRKPCVLMERTDRTDRGWYCSEYVYYYGDDEITAWVPITVGETVVIR